MDPVLEVSASSFPPFDFFFGGESSLELSDDLDRLIENRGHPYLSGRKTNIEKNNRKYRLPIKIVAHLPRVNANHVVVLNSDALSSSNIESHTDSSIF